MEFVIISSYPLYFWNFYPSVGLIRANQCSNNFSRQQIPLISVSLNYTGGLRFVFPISTHRHAIMNQSEARLHSGHNVHFCPSLSPRPSFRFSEGLVPRLLLSNCPFPLPLLVSLERGLTFGHTCSIDGDRMGQDNRCTWYDTSDQISWLWRINQCIVQTKLDIECTIVGLTHARPITPISFFLVISMGPYSNL